jgi:hypothetical protein
MDESPYQPLTNLLFRRLFDGFIGQIVEKIPHLERIFGLFGLFFAQFSSSLLKLDYPNIVP